MSSVHLAPARSAVSSSTACSAAATSPGWAAAAAFQQDRGEPGLFLLLQVVGRLWEGERQLSWQRSAAVGPAGGNDPGVG
jgi:hypothetical protein